MSQNSGDDVAGKSAPLTSQAANSAVAMPVPAAVIDLCDDDAEEAVATQVSPSRRLRPVAEQYPINLLSDSDDEPDGLVRRVLWERPPRPTPKRPRRAAGAMGVGLQSEHDAEVGAGASKRRRREPLRTLERGGRGDNVEMVTDVPATDARIDGDGGECIDLLGDDDWQGCPSPELSPPGSPPDSPLLIIPEPRPVVARRPPRPKAVTDECAPVFFSQASLDASLSLSGLGQTQQPPSSSVVDVTSEADPPVSSQGVGVMKTSHTVAFDYVIREVLERQAHILRPRDVELAKRFRAELSLPARSLFVRIYRRKQPQWYRLSALLSSYDNDFDVDTAMAELVAKRFVTSSEELAKAANVTNVTLACEMMQTLSLAELKAVADTLEISMAKSLKRLPRRRLEPALQAILSDTKTKEKSDKGCAGNLTQTTLTGLSPVQRLAREILKTVGHSIKIPTYILTSLRRMHFLFFLDAGHDSPNIILAECGKASFPAYECKTSRTVFLSSYAYEDYERACQLESQLDYALSAKNYLRAEELGSIAELEVREFFGSCTDRTVVAAVREVLQTASQSQRPCGLSSVGLQPISSNRSAARRVNDRKDAETQLRHPFLRRYSAQWVYVRAAWHSVSALEKLGEFERATERLRLLLSTRMMPKRRGKCLDRLTINLYRHLSRPDEALQIILKALAPDAPLLHYGDLVALAKRGQRLHRDLTLHSAEASVPSRITSKAGRKKAVANAVVTSRPPVLDAALAKVFTKVEVRKILGRALPNVDSTSASQLPSVSQDAWQSSVADRSLDSITSGASQSRATGVKSRFVGFASGSHSITVEQLAIEWYKARMQWKGAHDEGKAVRFIHALLFWDCLFAAVPDVFHTAFQDRPLDWSTEAYYESRRSEINARIREVECLSRKELRAEVELRYERYRDIRCVGCAWTSYSASDLACVAGGAGGAVIAHCCHLLSLDSGYWGGGMPDLVLWRDEGNEPETKFVEVKSSQDALSERQRAWLSELCGIGASVEVCKVVEKVTPRNAAALKDADLDATALAALDTLGDVDEHNDE